MSVKDLLVHLDASGQAGKRLDIAIELARRFEAHLVGIFVVDVMTAPEMMMAGADGLLVANWVQDLESRAIADAARAADLFKERTDRAGITSEWRQLEGPLATTVSEHARYADLTVLGQSNPDQPDRNTVAGLIEEVLFASGRPILLIPYAGDFPTVGRNVVIGWNASREAARAANDAIPLMRQAERISVLSADPSGGISDEGADPAADIALHLARHGLKVTAASTPSGDLQAGDILLNYAADTGADLLVMGGYGHSRVRELVLGGATRGVLTHATVPVLMSR